MNDVVAAGQELDEEMMSKLSNMKVFSLNSSCNNLTFQSEQYDKSCVVSVPEVFRKHKC